MNCMIKSVLAVVIVGAMALSAQAQTDNVFFSYSNTNPNQTSPTTPWHAIINTPGNSNGANRKVYIWVTSATGQDITPADTGLTPKTINSVVNDVPNSSAGILLNYTTTGSNLAFTKAQDYNYTLTYNGVGTNPVSGTDINGSVRSAVWNQVSTIQSGNTGFSPTAITGVEANVVPTTTYNTGDTVGATGNPTGVSLGFANTQASASVNVNPALHSGAFLLGELDFTTSAYGTQTITIAPNTATGALTNGSGTDLTSLYTYGTLTVSVTKLTGDTDGDGFVGLQDLNNVFNGFGTTYHLQDLNDVFNNFGTGNGTFSAVPEPASMGLVALGGLAMFGGWRIRKKK